MQSRIHLSTENSYTGISFMGSGEISLSFSEFKTYANKFLTNINPWALIGVDSATNFLIKISDPYFSLWMHPKLMLLARYLH